MNAKLSSKSSSHLTPKYIVEAARQTLGAIDLDPATTRSANRLIRAKAILTESDDGLAHDWKGRVFLNPPGGSLDKAAMIHGFGSTRSRQVLWWLKLMQQHRRGSVVDAIFIGFSIELLQTAQKTKAPHSYLPTDYPMCIPSSRIAFDHFEDGKRIGTKQPTHANVIVLVSGNENMREQFEIEFDSIGEVFNL